MEKKGTLEVGDKFGKYTVERLLGRGGMGAVYLVRHQLLGSLFALKILDVDVAHKNVDFKTRFIREGKLAATIKHPNLIAVHDAGYDETHGVYYLLMDYVPGGNLRDRILDRGRLTPEEAVFIARQIAAVLVTTAKNGMVHRDIKPENIMFAVDGSVKLADLGIAKGNGEQDTLVTIASSVFGTPAYMAPEQAQDASAVDCRADIWSLGVVMYEMLSGKRPYDGKGVGAIVAQLLSPDPFPDVRTVAPDVPEQLAQTICAMCAKDRDERLANPREVLERLSSLNLSLPQSHLHGGSSSRPANVTLATLATLATERTMATLNNDDADGETPESNVAPPTLFAAPTLDEPVHVFVEPETDPDVRAVERGVNARLANRESSPRRLRLILWAVLGVLLLLLGGMLMHKARLARPPGEGITPPASPEKETPSPVAPQPETEIQTVATNKMPVEQHQPLPVVETPSPEQAKPKPMRGEPVVQNPVDSTSTPREPVTVVIGLPAEEGRLKGLAGGNVRYQKIGGRPEAVQGQITAMVATHPGKIILSLSGYATAREMSPVRFELFLREISKGLSASGVPFAFVAGSGEYGSVIRNVARDMSLDLID